jgi:hypothetical protein
VPQNSKKRRNNREKSLLERGESNNHRAFQFSERGCNKRTILEAYKNSTTLQGWTQME